jgi:hypothetical protein
VAFKHIGPYSRLLRTAPLAGLIDGRSATGRFIRDLEQQLFEHVGGRERATITQKLLVDRIIRLRLRLDAFEDKLAGGQWTDLDSRTFGGLQNAYRLTLRELGPLAKAQVPLTAVDYAAHRTKGKAA